MMKNNIVMCGIQEQGIDIIKFLFKYDIKVTHIVTITKEVAIKNKSGGTWVSYEDIAEELGIEIYYAHSYSFVSFEDVEYFKSNKFDVLLLGGWQRLISKEILDTIKYPIGQHGSPEFLPKGKGRSPLNWAIIQGKRRLIWNLFLLTSEIDAGAILDYQIFEIGVCDTCQTLYYKVSTSVKYMLVRTLPKLLNGTALITEQKGTSSYFSKRIPEDGRINWNNSVYVIYDLIRGITAPYPGAFTEYKNKKIMIWKAQVWDTIIDFYKDNEYGEIVELFSLNYVVKCYDGLLLVTKHDDDNIFENKKYK